MKESVQAVIDQIRPMLQRDGGDVELVDVDEGGVVKEDMQRVYVQYAFRYLGNDSRY